MLQILKVRLWDFLLWKDILMFPELQLFTCRRSTGLDSPQYIPELGAQLAIQSESGGSIPLAEAGNGIYSVDSLNLDPTQQYRLQILTAGKEYLSDLSKVNLTPPIDSVNWTANTDGVSIFVSAHNDQGSA